MIYLDLTPPQRYFVDRLFHDIDNNPGVLLEHHCVPPTGGHDVAIARLIGREDEIVSEERFDRAPREVFTPDRRLVEASWQPPDAEPTYVEDVRWLPQSVYAIGGLHAELAGDWPIDPVTHRCRVAAVRYRLANPAI